MTLLKRDTIYIVVSNPQMGNLLQQELGRMNCLTTVFTDREAAVQAIHERIPTLLVVAESIPPAGGIDLVNEVQEGAPVISTLLLVENETPELLKSALRAGVSDFLDVPFSPEELLTAAQSCMQKGLAYRDRIQGDVLRETADLEHRVTELETLVKLGSSITRSLEIDSILSAVVDAAVELTGAEEGSLLLLDEESGELYMRASRNFNKKFAETFRLPIQDTMIGSVLSSGQSMLLDEKTPQKIKTSYLVYSLVYVPLQIKGRTFGVLGVDNREKRQAFQDRDVQILMALAEYAVIALDNAGLYSASTRERSKLETVIKDIHDGVIVVDADRRLVIVNTTVLAAFGLENQTVIGHTFSEIFTDNELLRLVETRGKSLSNQAEVRVADGRVFSATISEIPEVGAAITLHDITYLKKLDRIKSDFVSTVSHDLRSPLTAIMGYVELIERAGPVNDRQRDFIRRVHANVQNITGLMDDLLNLGHIESGFDSTKEMVFLEQIIRFSVDNFNRQASVKEIELKSDLPGSLPPVLANPVQMRQMIDNLIDNAIKYTSPGGTVHVTAVTEMDQVILQVSDTGKGISPLDLPYIFDKFYRGVNVTLEVPGTGLGLSIVKSIVESHQGRIWVDSPPGKGATFTVVLPLVKAVS